MFVEIVHVNGRYNPDTATHTPLDRSEVVLRKLRVIAEIAIHAGHDVLYLPNLSEHAAAVGSSALTQVRAIGSDPFFSGLSDNTRRKVTVKIDGSGASPKQNKDIRDTEDRLVRQHGVGFVLGAFTSACVAYYAANIKARNPQAYVQVDPEFCLPWSGKDPYDLGRSDLHIDTISTYLDINPALLYTKL